jgi:hypothetical protein
VAKQVKPNFKGGLKTVKTDEVDASTDDQPEIEPTVPGAVRQRSARLTPAQITDIEDRIKAGGTPKGVAEELGLQYPAVLRIKNQMAGGPSGTRSTRSAAAAPSGGDSELKRRLIAYAVASLMTPDAVDIAERDALTKLLNDDLQAKIDAVKTQYMMSL